IAVLDDYQHAFRKVSDFARLKGHDVAVFHDNEKDPVKLIERLADADAVVLNQDRTSITRTVVEKLPRLRLIAQTGNHRRNSDIVACTEHGIVIAIAAGDSDLSRSTAELTWALILASVRHLPHEVQQLKQGMWQTTPGTRLYGRTLGIYALGRIGGWV